MIDILIQLLIEWLQVNFINLLLYPFSVSDYTSPNYVILGILLGDLTSEISLLLLNLLSA